MVAGRRSLVGRSAVSGLVAVVLAVGAGLLGAAPASAATPAPGGPTAVGSVPPEVQAAYDGEFLRRMVTSTHGTSGQLRAGTVHQIFTFTQDFVEGGSTADPVEAGEAWIAGVEVDGEPVGWQRTFLDDGGAVQSSGWNPDPDGAEAFLAVTAGALVEVPSDGALFTLVDGVVTPVRVPQWDAGLGPRSLAQVQADFAVSRAETAAAYACCRPSDGCAGGGIGVAGAGPATADCPSRLLPPGVLALAGVAVALVVGVGWTALRQGRSRRLDGASARWMP